MVSRKHLLFSNWTIAEVNVFLLLIICPLYYHLNVGGFGLSIPNNSTIWIAAVAFIFLSLNKSISLDTFLVPNKFLLISAFPIIVTISSIITGAENPLAWLFRLLFIWGGLLFLFSLSQYRWRARQIDRILFFIVVSGVLQLLLAVAQMELGPSLPNIFPQTPEKFPIGFFQQVNNLASYLVTCVVVFLYLLSRPSCRHIGKDIFCIAIFVFLLTGYVIGASGSRIGLVDLLLALPIIIFARYRYIENNKYKIMFMLIFLCIGLTLGMSSQTKTAVTKIKATTQSGYSADNRLGIYNISIGLIKDEPLWGHGLGSFARVWQYSKPEFYKEHPEASLPNRMVTHPHNEILFWLVEGGILSLLGLLITMMGATLAIYQVGRSRGLGYLAMLLPITLHTQVELPFYVSSLHWFVFLTLLWLPLRHFQKQKQATVSKSMKILSQYSLWIAFGGVMFFLLNTMRANWDFIDFYSKNPKERIEPLHNALANPYLHDQAEWINNSRIMHASIKLGIDDNVIKYVNWGEEKLKTLPEPDLYIKLSEAYKYLGEHSKYCHIIAKGLSLYPDKSELKNLNQNCM